MGYEGYRLRGSLTVLIVSVVGTAIRSSACLVLILPLIWKASKYLLTQIYIYPHRTFIS